MPEYTFSLPDGVYTVNTSAGIFKIDPLPGKGSEESIAECERIWNLRSPDAS